MNSFGKSLFLALSISSLSSLHAMKDGDQPLTQNQLVQIMQAINKDKETSVDLTLPHLSEIAWTPGKAAKLAALGFFVWTIVVFLSTEPHDKPVRYSWDEVWEGKNLWENFKYLIIDGLIGHKAKTRSLRIYESGKVDAQQCDTLGIDPETKQAIVVPRPGAPAKGIYGKIYEKLVPMEKGLKFLSLLSVYYASTGKGARQWFVWLGI